MVPARHQGVTYWLEILFSIRGFKSTAGRSAPYKPLLLLWLIGRVLNGRGEGVAFEEARDEIRQLLSPYRLGNSQPKPEHPFVYLGQTPEIWSVRDSKGQDIAEMIAPIDSTSRTPARETLSFLKAEAVGSLSPRFVAALGDPEVLDAIVKELLKRSVPESEYTMLLEKVRLLNHVRLASAPWDSAFKDMVVMAYRYRCSFCDFSARLQNRPVGLDAVPVRIPAKGGPKDLSNAVTLCSRDHKLFAAGALGLGFVGAERRSW